MRSRPGDQTTRNSVRKIFYKTSVFDTKNRFHKFNYEQKTNTLRRARALRGASRENTTGQAAAGVRVDRVTRQCT